MGAGMCTRGNSSFQSTLPVRGATKAAEIASWLYGFQSTLPVRGATLEEVEGLLFQAISIHAPREGSDHKVPDHPPDIPNFNPRSP